MDTAGVLPLQPPRSALPALQLQVLYSLQCQNVHNEPNVHYVHNEPDNVHYAHDELDNDTMYCTQ